MGFGWGNWLVVLLPMLCILGVALYCRRYVRDMADYLSAGRVARRYVVDGHPAFIVSERGLD